MNLHKKKFNMDKLLLYFISLSLLFILIIVITIDIPLYFGEDPIFIKPSILLKKNIIPLFSLIMFLSSMYCLYKFNDSLKGSKKNAIDLTNVENLNYEPLAFLVTYILPLICLDFDNFRYIIVLILLLIIIGRIYVKTNMFYANPTLAIMGFHIYKVSGNFGKSEVQDNVVIISRSTITNTSKIYWRKLDEKVYFVQEVVNEKSEK